MWQYGNHWSPLPKQFWKKGKDRNKIAVFKDREGGEEVEIVTFFLRPVVMKAERE